jgi:hemoglobin/transferrin/lactoferrin receptor protein
MRMPNIDELYSTQSASSSLPRTSRSLEVERNNNFQIGVETIHDQLFMSDDQLKIRATAYYNHVTNPINRRFGTKNAPEKRGEGDTYWNLPSYYSTGIELSAHYDTTYMFADVAFSTMYGSRHGALNNIYGYDTYLKDLAPATLVTTLGWKLPDQDLTLGWTGTFVARQTKTPHNQGGKDYARPESAGYGIHDLFLTWAPQSGMMKDTKLDIGLDNIFDKKYEPYLSDGISAMPGRNFKVSLSRQF